MKFLKTERLTKYLEASMKHVILGAGNLGKDLDHELSSRDSSAILLSKSEGLNFKDLITFDAVKDLAPDYVWVAVGGGSVNEAKLDSPSHENAKYLNQTLPITLNYDLPTTTKVIFFSTDYCADESKPHDPESYTSSPRSEYAKQKLEMEHKIMNAGIPNRAIIRVGSLFGFHKPWKTLPGKLLNNPNKIIELPNNLITPTPTRWLAFVLSQSLDVLFDADVPKTHHCAPMGNISVLTLGKLLLGPERIKPKNEFDKERPQVSNLGCSFLETDPWEVLWELYFKKEDYE